MPHELSVHLVIHRDAVDAMIGAGDFHALLAHLDDLQPSLHTPERALAYEAQFEAIDRLGLVPKNWSLDPAATPKAEQTLAARSGLIRLYLAGIPAPKMMVQEDGTVGAYWRRGDNYASVDFDADGMYSWCAAKGSDVVAGAWSDGPLPIPLRDVIAA